METDNQTQAKTRIYNLIILDKSGSMSTIRTAAYQGCNEVLGGIRAAAVDHAADQEQFVSLLLFDTRSMPYIHKCTPAKDAQDLTPDQYQPCAGTPLLDAMGMSLTELEQETDKYDDAVGMVTVITDGYENASREWNYPRIQELVGRLKQKGWNFAFMGANQDVTKVCIDLNINVGNAHAFSFSEEGMRDSWRRDREAKERYYNRMSEARVRHACMTKDEVLADYFAINASSSYFEEPENEQPQKPSQSLWQKLHNKHAGNGAATGATSASDPSVVPDASIAGRITPEHVTQLAQNEIFVFGSNAQGIHDGGAAAFALRNFGAVLGQGEGLQGHSYAIPTTGSLSEMAEAVERFTRFAQLHPELRFLVTAVGCGHAGFNPATVASLFRPASGLSNVCLPQVFFDLLRS